MKKDLHKIHYTEKGQGLHDTVAKAGFRLADIDGVWLADSPEVQSIIDSYTASDCLSSIVEEIKAKAGTIILSKYPQWRQNNMTSRYIELKEIENKSQEVIDELASLRSQWDAISRVRSYSNQLEAQLGVLAAANDFQGILSFDWESGWPSI